MSPDCSFHRGKLSRGFALKRQSSRLASSNMFGHLALPSSSCSRSLPRLFPYTAIANRRFRHLHTSLAQWADTPKTPVHLIATLRRACPVPIALAREALANSNDDLDRALAYIERSLSSSEAKAAKVSGRSTNEGTIAVSLLSGKRVSMIHLGCETDFVARNDVFLNTARGVAGTAAFLDVPSDAGPPEPQLAVDPIQDFPTDALLSAPLIALPPSDSSSPIPTHEPTTVRQTLLSALGSTGENLKLLRAVSFAAPFPSSPTIRFIPGCFAHGGPGDTEGKVGGIVVLSAISSVPERLIATLVHGPGGEDFDRDLSKLARTIARQVVGFPTRVISRKSKGGDGVEDEEVLLEQPFMMMGQERRVGEVMDEWGQERGAKVSVVGMRRWAVSDVLGMGGDAPEKVETEDGA